MTFDPDEVRSWLETPGLQAFGWYDQANGWTPDRRIHDALLAACEEIEYWRHEHGTPTMAEVRAAIEALSGANPIMQGGPPARGRGRMR